MSALPLPTLAYGAKVVNAPLVLYWVLGKIRNDLESKGGAGAIKIGLAWDKTTSSYKNGIQLRTPGSVQAARVHSIMLQINHFGPTARRDFTRVGYECGPTSASTESGKGSVQLDDGSSIFWVNWGVTSEEGARGAGSSERGGGGRTAAGREWIGVWGGPCVSKDGCAGEDRNES
ncbi:hypothetical protein BDK51DRAFT_25467 [Blyttiomyces helicus]|uniref:Uncharacterized protein n=1 Tax=Blyttiomyces helicus TaxID=388810 RepID=A0A4P9WJW8_9FUNG|nr:hypothetical protein BDK51DRAFT_25467 [Blyttiomyces helicus]|eukprot:RKO93241.1 hypothetical protein BDK51DRAFT_25467 [Blyttiomyces helicus]